MPVDVQRERSELEAAAAAFAAELAVFGKLAAAAQGLALTSQKGLQRASRLFQEIRDSETRLGASGQALVKAIGNARERQQAQATAIEARASELKERAAQATALLERYASLGEEAAELNVAAQELMATQQAELGDSAARRDVHERLSLLVGGAQALAEAARQAGFADITHQTDALRQQLLAVRNKIALMSGIGRGVAKA